MRLDETGYFTEEEEENSRANRYKERFNSKYRTKLKEYNLDKKEEDALIESLKEYEDLEFSVRKGHVEYVFIRENYKSDKEVLYKLKEFSELR